MRASRPGTAAGACRGVLPCTLYIVSARARGCLAQLVVVVVVTFITQQTLRKTSHFYGPLCVVHGVVHVLAGPGAWRRGRLERRGRLICRSVERAERTGRAARRPPGAAIKMLLLLLLLGLSAVPLVIIRPGRRRPPRICRLDSAELGACAFFADRLGLPSTGSACTRRTVPWCSALRF